MSVVASPIEYRSGSSRSRWHSPDPGLFLIKQGSASNAQTFDYKPVVGYHFVQEFALRTRRLAAIDAVRMIWRIIPTASASKRFSLMQTFEPTTFIEPPRQCLATLESCRIRTCRVTDADAVRQWLDAPDIWRFVMDDKPAEVTIRHAELYLSIEHTKPRCLTFAVASLEEDRLIGVLQAQFGEFATAHSAELAGWLARPYWGSGVPRQTTTVFTDWLFSERHALRVYAAPFHQNRASIGTLEACGFSFEGRLRAAALKNGRLMDQMMYAKLSPSTASLPRAAGRPPRRLPVEQPPAPNAADWA